MKEQSIKTIGHDIHSVMQHSDIEVVWMIIGNQIIIRTMIIYGDEVEMINHEITGDE